MYRKQRDVVRLKQRKGSFSLSNQVVLFRDTRKVVKGLKVYSITEHNNVLRGYIKCNDTPGLRTKRVEQIGVSGWSTINRIDEAHNRNKLNRS